MSELWEVFYTPHTDDESIGMAGAIARARALNHPVLVVLVSDNKPSPHGLLKFQKNDVETVAHLRRTEWHNAMNALGVNRTEEWNLSEADMVRSPFQVQTEIFRRVKDIHERLAPVCHHTTWGIHDVSHNGNGSLTHGLCANALTKFAYARSGGAVMLYSVYMYALPKTERHAPIIRALMDEEMTLKCSALDCYRPTGKNDGYGYKSVPELIDGASQDPHEYLVEISHG